MSSRTTPPFRADHVGSLLRPKIINDAFKNYKAGSITQDEVRAIEDTAIKDVIKLQTDVGLQVVTDGEFRRASYWSTFVERVNGLEISEEIDQVLSTYLTASEPKVIKDNNSVWIQK